MVLLLLLLHLRAADAHGDAHLGLLKRRGVVDAVARHRLILYNVM